MHDPVVRFAGRLAVAPTLYEQLVVLESVQSAVDVVPAVIRLKAVIEITPPGQDIVTNVGAVTIAVTETVRVKVNVPCVPVREAPPSKPPPLTELVTEVPILYN